MVVLTTAGNFGPNISRNPLVCRGWRSRKVTERPPLAELVGMALIQEAKRGMRVRR
jgi:hypothetical protein